MNELSEIEKNALATRTRQGEGLVAPPHEAGAGGCSIILHEEMQADCYVSYDEIAACLKLDELRKRVEALENVVHGRGRAPLGSKTYLADCLSKDDLDAIVPEPNEEADFCEDCRTAAQRLKEWEAEQTRLETKEWKEGEIRFGSGCRPQIDLHVCPNDIYKSGMLHEVVKKIVVQILSKISVGP